MIEQLHKITDKSTFVKWGFRPSTRIWVLLSNTAYLVWQSKDAQHFNVCMSPEIDADSGILCQVDSLQQAQDFIIHDSLSKGVPAKNFCQTLKVNVDNPKLTDEEFRDFVRKTLPIVNLQ